jgi:cell division protein FtsB
MKKLLYVFILLFTLSAFTLPSFANERTPVKKEITADEQLELNNITTRVNEIKALDKSALSKADKKALKKEVKELKKRADFLNQNVTLSLGAIIIILLLLIIIL